MLSSQLFAPATPRQKVAISRLLRALGVSRAYEQQGMSQAEAGLCLRKLGEQIKLRRKEKWAAITTSGT